MDGASRARVRAAPALLVARALARSWLHRPVRLIVAVAGGIGAVLLTTAVLTIATPVLMSTRVPPLDGIAAHVIAVAARAPSGMSDGLANRIARGSGAAASARILLANTTVRGERGGFVPIVVIGVGRTLGSMLEPDAARKAPPLTPGDAYLQRSWANRHHLTVGSRLEVTTPTGLARWTVGALSNTAFANNGSSVVVPATTAAAAFDRGTSVDVLLLRADGDVSAVRRRAAALADGAADVVSPNRVFASYGRIYRTPLMLVTMFGAIALLVGGVVLFLTWRLALADGRPILSRLRLLGVRSSDLLLGSGLVLVPILITCYVVGATAGCIIGRSLSSFRDQITNFTGQAFDPSLNLLLPLLGAFAAAVTMFGFAWLTGLRRLRRVTAIEAITGRDALTFERSRVRWPMLAGLGCFAIASVVVAFASGVLRASGAVPLLLGVAILSASLPVLAGSSIRTASTGSSGLLVGRQLEVEWRHNAALAVTFAIALLSSIAIFGVAASILNDIDQSNARWTKGQLYATAAPLGHNYESETFPPSIRDAIAAVPGVRSADTFSYVNAVVGGGRHLLETVGGDAAALTAPRLTAGPRDVVDGRKSLFDALTGEDVAVSSNFARTQHLGIGSTLEIPVSSGHRVGRVIAVIDDAVSDGGMVMVGPALFRQVAGGSRVFYVGVGLEHRADLGSVRERVRALVAARYPRAQVLTVAQYRADVSSLLSRLMSSFSAFAWVMYGVAAIVGTATLASSIAERGRAVALTRLAGARRRTIRNLLGVEAMITVTIAWLVAVLGALLAIPALIAGQSLFSGLLPHARLPLDMVGISLPLAAIATLAALFVARRSVSERPLAQSIADE
jgi:putative ABC transport system permease protein